MPSAGQYNTRLTWLQQTTVTDEDTGDVVNVHVPAGYLWASVSEDSGRRQEEAGAPQSGVNVEIRVHNYPDLLATDLLEDDFFGYVYHLDSIHNGNDELIIEAYRYDKLLNFNIGEDSD